MAMQLTLTVKNRAALLVTLSAILYGMLGYLGTKVVEQQFSINNMLFWRFFIAMLWIGLTSLHKLRQSPPMAIRYSALVAAIVLGSVFYAANSGFYFVAATFAGTGLAMVIFFAYPIFVVLFAWCLEGKKIKKTTTMALAAIMIGMIFLSSGHDVTLNLYGVFFAVLGALCYAIYFYNSKHFSLIIPPYLQTILICAGCAFIFFFLALFDHTLAWPTTWQACLVVGALGVFATALPIQLLLEGLKYIHPNKAAIMSAFEPVVTLMLGMFFLGEVISVLQLLGALIIIIAAVSVH